jgi:hypothetical protein
MRIPQDTSGIHTETQHRGLISLTAEERAQRRIATAPQAQLEVHPAKTENQVSRKSLSRTEITKSVESLGAARHNAHGI